MELRRGGAWYKVSPWALLWDDENYYLVGYDAADDKIKHFRVDKMLKTKEIEEKRQGVTRYKKQDKEMYSKKHFRMFGGEEQLVTLVCENKLANVIIDQFGRDTVLRPVDEDHFEVRVDVVLSDQFLGWVIALGEGVTITGPEEVVGRMSEIWRKLSKKYK